MKLTPSIVESPSIVILEGLEGELAMPWREYEAGDRVIVTVGAHAPPLECVVLADLGPDVLLCSPEDYANGEGRSVSHTRAKVYVRPATDATARANIEPGEERR